MIGYAVWVIYYAVKGRENPSVSVTLEVRRRAYYCSTCMIHDCVNAFRVVGNSVSA